MEKITTKMLGNWDEEWVKLISHLPQYIGETAGIWSVWEVVRDNVMVTYDVDGEIKWGRLEDAEGL